MPLKALALNSTLKPQPQQSSTEKLLREVLGGLSQFGVASDALRIVDFNVKPGVTSDEKRWARPITRTCRRSRPKSRRPPQCWRRTPRIWLTC